MLRVVKDSNDIADELKFVLSSIKEQFDDHIVSINENTNEIQSNYEFLCEIDSRIEKLNERIDKIELMFNGTSQKSEYHVRDLTLREQEVFLVLYTSDEPLTYVDLSRKTALSASLVQSYLINIIAKGVPIVKRYVGNVVYLSLDREFIKLQARKGIVKIEDSVLQSISV